MNTSFCKIRKTLKQPHADSNPLWPFVSAWVPEAGLTQGFEGQSFIWEVASGSPPVVGCRDEMGEMKGNQWRDGDQANYYWGQLRLSLDMTHPRSQGAAELSDDACWLGSTMGIFAMTPETIACMAHFTLDIPLEGERAPVTSTPGAYISCLLPVLWGWEQEGPSGLFPYNLFYLLPWKSLIPSIRQCVLELVWPGSSWQVVCISFQLWIWGYHTGSLKSANVKVHLRNWPVTQIRVFSPGAPGVKHLVLHHCITSSVKEIQGLEKQAKWHHKKPTW